MLKNGNRPKSYRGCLQIHLFASLTYWEIFVRKRVLASQRSERWFSCVKKMTRPIKIANDVFSCVRKMIPPIRSYVSFAPKFPPFLAAGSAASNTFNEKSFSRRVFLIKKVENISKMEWNSFVCFTVDKENCREPAKKQRKGENRTRRRLMLCFL